ncbi:hypothetical protein BDW62DRAFT_202187 [Aspergillus aurantiobrunneus]
MEGCQLVREQGLMHPADKSYKAKNSLEHWRELPRISHPSVITIPPPHTPLDRPPGNAALWAIACYGLTQYTPHHTHYDAFEEVLQLQPLTVGRNDLPEFLRTFDHKHIYQSNFSGQIELPDHVDFPRLARGRIRAQFWSVYVACNGSESESSPRDYEYIHDTLQQIDLVHRLASLYPNNLTLVPSSSALRHTFDTSPSLIASLLGVEGLHQIGCSASTLRLYHSLGARYTTLTHVCHNQYADSASPAHHHHNGLSPAGRHMVLEMNRLGMAVDLAHASAKTMHDALDTSRASVIFSHSSVYALCPNPRNVPNDVLLRLRENNGIIMITFFPAYTRCDDPEAATLSDVADHIYKYPDLIAELLRRGISIEDMAAVTGGNILRVLGEIERVGRRYGETGGCALGGRYAFYFDAGGWSP